MGFGTPLSRVRRSTAVTTLSANNTTASVVMFTLTGSVILHRLWGVVTTVIGANHTAGHCRLNDQTATVDISSSTGITLSGLAVGTLITRNSAAAAALALDSNAVGAITDTTASQEYFTPIALIKKTGAVTTLDYRYSTTDAPTSGAITWYAEWEPLSADGNLA